MADPDLTIENLELWVLDRPYLDSELAWDRNWLDIKVKYKSEWSLIEFCMQIRVIEIQSFMESCETVNRLLDGEIQLECLESNISLNLRIDKQGQIKGDLIITQHPDIEKHEYEINIDQSYLPDIINQCKIILNKYPNIME